MKFGLATRSAIERMVALEAGKEEKIGRAAELMTIDDDEFVRRLNAPSVAGEEEVIGALKKIMNRSVQGLCIVLGSIASIAAVLAAALAWGRHHCDPEFPKIVGCAIATYEDLAGAMVAAAAAVFAGWLAWSGVQVQIAVEEKRAAADRVEVEQVLQDDLDTFAEVLGAIWKILDRWDEMKTLRSNNKKSQASFMELNGSPEIPGLVRPEKWSRHSAGNAAANTNNFSPA